MITRTYVTFVFILSLSFSQTVFAAGGYHVEALLFSQTLNAQENGNEVWPEEKINFWQSELNPLRREINKSSTITSKDHVRFLRVPTTSLVSASTLLTRNAHYGVLKFLAWELPPLKKAQSPVVPLSTPNTSTGLDAANSATTLSITPEITGGIKTYTLGNFLYLQINLCRTVPNPASTTITATTQATDYSTPSLNTSHRIANVRFCIQEKRRIKLGQLNYFDHPGMGLLVRVDRAEQFVLPETPKPAAINASGATGQ